MKKLDMEFKHCYGISYLKHTINFDKHDGCVIYSPNGTMKTSFANTFKDYSKGKIPKDKIFDRVSSLSIVDEREEEINKSNIFVISSIEKHLKFNKTSQLLVNQDLKRKYDSLLKEIYDSKVDLIKAIQKDLKANDKDRIRQKDVENIISQDLGKEKSDFIHVILY